MRAERSVIVSEAGGSPTDLYITEGAMQGRPNLSRRLLGENGANLDDVLDEENARSVDGFAKYEGTILIVLDASRVIARC